MSRPYALLLPGQGAQFVGMGKDLAQEFPAAQALFTQADEILGYPLSALCWKGPQEELTRTEYCQPALYLTSLAALAALESELSKRVGSLQGRKVSGRTLRPEAAAGLSLGEYTALVAAGALSFRDGLRLVHLRGKVMEEASRLKPGTMASILGLDLAVVEALCRETGAQVANLNAPGQIVISGSVEAVQAASERARQKGAKRVIPLEVGGAFHSHLMEPAAQRLRLTLQGVEVRTPRYPVLSNVTGSNHIGPDQIRALLVEQLTQPVRWEGCMRSLLGAGIKTFLEVGAGTVLKGLARKIDPEANVLPVGTVEQVEGVLPLIAQWA